MNIAIFPYWLRLLATGALCAFLLSPYAARALGIGEIVLQSRLGEPLHVQVELHAGKDEPVDNSCLSLTRPDPQEDGAHGYLTRATLEIRNDGGRQYVDISSHTSFKEMFARFRLQVKCPNMGAVIKTLAFLPDLPDLNESSFPSLTPTPEPPPEADVTPKPALTNKAQVSDAAPGGATYPAPHPAAAPAPPEKTAQRTGSNSSNAPQPLSGAVSQLKNKPKVIAPDMKAAGPATRQPAQSAHASNETLPSGNAERRGKKPDNTISFRLKLSSAPLDVSRIGKLSAKEREALLAQQKMLDADDQTARFLALQHQVKQLQNELTGIKLQMAQLDNGQFNAASPPASALPVAKATAAAPSPDTPSVATPPVVAASSPVAQGSRPRPVSHRPAIALNQPPAQQTGLLESAYIAAGLVLAALALLLGLRYYTRIKSRRTAAAALHKARRMHLNAGIAPPAAAGAVAQPPVHAVSIQPLIIIPSPAAAKEDAAPSAEPTPQPVPAPKDELIGLGSDLTSRKVITPAQLDAALLQQQVASSATRPDDTPDQERKPLDFGLESPTGKNPVPDMNFEQELDKTVVLSPGSRAAIFPQVPDPVADVNFDQELDKAVVLSPGSLAAISPQAPVPDMHFEQELDKTVVLSPGSRAAIFAPVLDPVADANFEQELDKTVVLSLGSRAAISPQAPDPVADMNFEQALDKTVVLSPGSRAAIFPQVPDFDTTLPNIVIPEIKFHPDMDATGDHASGNKPDPTQ